MVLPPLPPPTTSRSQARSRPRNRGRRARALALANHFAALFAALFAGIAPALLTGLLACARPEDVTISPAEYDRDRDARADLSASIAADHETLAAMIGAERFADPTAIYSDPELRTIAKRLIAQSRELERLSSTDVLAPGAP